MEEIERLEQKINEVDAEFKDFRKRFYDLEKSYIVSANKIDNMYNMLLEIKGQMKKPLEILINILTPLITSGITWILAYFIMKGGK